MSATKHTPGPWTRDEHFPIYVWGPNHAMVADLPHRDEDAYLARMRGVGRGATREEQEANCSLIAAAPDLLEAAKVARAYIEGEGLAFLPELDAAIAKAEGRR